MWAFFWNLGDWMSNELVCSSVVMPVSWRTRTPFESSIQGFSVLRVAGSLIAVRALPLGRIRG